MIKRILKSSLIALIFVILLSSVVLAYTYSATISVVESGGNAYITSPFSLTINNAYLASQSYITPSGLDVAINTGGSAIPTMVAGNKTNFVTSLPANNTITATMTLGNTPVTSMPVIVGYNGYVTTSDNANLEFSNQFSSEFYGYVDTSYAASKNLLYKLSAFRTYISSGGTITSAINGVYKDTFTTETTVGTTYGALWEAQTFTPATSYDITGVSLKLTKFNAPAGNFDYSIRATAAGVPTGADLVSGSIVAATLGGAAYVDLSFTSYLSLTAGTVYAIVVSCPSGDIGNNVRWALDAGAGYAGGQRCSSADSGATWAGAAGDYVFKTIGELNVSATVSSGEHNIQSHSDGTIFELDIDNPTRITNGSYEVNDPPLGWTFSGAGGTFSRSNTQVKIDSYSAKIIRSGADCAAYQDLLSTLDGQTVVFGCWVWASVNNRARLNINDGVTQSFSSYQTGSSSWQWLTVTKTIDAGAAHCFIALVLDTGDTTAYYDGATLQINSILFQTTNGMIHSVDLSSASVPDNSNNWLIDQTNAMPYFDFYKHTTAVGSYSEKFKYQPSYLIGTTAYSAGTATFTQGSTAVLGIGTTFTSDMWGGLIKPTGDTAYYTVASVTDATHLTLTSAYTPVTNTSTYAILADRLQDLDNFTYLGTITWGSNPAGVACTVSPLVSASNPGVLAGITTPQPDMATIVSNQGDLTGNDNAEVSTNLLTPLWQPWSDLTNIPVLVFLLIIGTTFLIVAVVYVMKKTQNQLIGSIVLIIGEAFLYKMGIYELWFVIITGLICLALIIMERKPAF